MVTLIMREEIQMLLGGNNLGGVNLTSPYFCANMYAKSKIMIFVKIKRRLKA